MHPSNQGIQPKTVRAALFPLLAIAIWLLIRGYHGLLGDAQLYAFQALARIHPELAQDLYLQNTSQDRFTIFSPAYAWFIDLFGLESAARFLTISFTVWFLGAAWSVARTLTGRDGAWLAVISLLIVDGAYGGSGVFRFLQEFLTARLPAEALVVMSVACFLRDSKIMAAVTATAALLIHPLIALPGLLLLSCLLVPIRTSVAGAAAGAMLALIISLAAANVAWVSQLLPTMDPKWLNIVQERSQFLFLRLWSFPDWEINTRPFFYLAFIAIAIHDNRVRQLCAAAAVVGATGMIIALFGGSIGPVALMVQGQSWRWMWLAAFVCVLLVPAALLQIWPDKKCVAMCAVLLILGLVLPAPNGTACVSLAIILWLMRSRYSTRQVALLRWILLAMLTAVAIWVLNSCWAIIWPVSGRPRSAAPVQLRAIFALKVPAVLGVSLIWWKLIRGIRGRPLVLLCTCLLALSIFVLPSAFKQSKTLASDADISEVGDWRAVIPPTSTVLVAPPRDVGTFVWFTLERPNYLAIDQSAGVVFWRQTALEVQRRSEVLQPIMEQNWKIWSNLRAGNHNIDAPNRPLTSATLAQICEDPQLGFVISHGHLGIAGLAHNVGPWSGWELYDCRKIGHLEPAK